MLERILKKVLPWKNVLSEDYMVRFFVWGSRGEDGGEGRAIRLHIIKGSDSARVFHNHPYAFRSFLLKGAYIEHTPDNIRRYSAGQINSKSLEDWHRLEIEKPVWSLVFTGNRRQDWGFWSGKQSDPFIPWREYKEED
jgi:hypothetical protein